MNEIMALQVVDLLPLAPVLGVEPPGSYTAPDGDYQHGYHTLPSMLVKATLTLPFASLKMAILVSEMAPIMASPL